MGKDQWSDFVNCTYHTFDAKLLKDCFRVYESAGAIFIVSQAISSNGERVLKKKFSLM